MKLTKFAVLAALASTTAAHAQDNDVVDADVDASTEIVDSFDDNTDNFVDSFDDNSERDFDDSFNDNSERTFEDSFDDNSQRFSTKVELNGDTNTFDDNAIVAETTLSNVVSGVDVNFGDLENKATFNSSLNNSDKAFQNYAGMNALNQNTGTGAAQNASVTIAVSGDGFDAN